MKKIALYNKTRAGVRGMTAPTIRSYLSLSLVVVVGLIRMAGRHLFRFVRFLLPVGVSWPV